MLIFIFINYVSVKFDTFDFVNEFSNIEGFFECNEILSNISMLFLYYKLNTIGDLAALFFIEFNNFNSYSFYFRF